MKETVLGVILGVLGFAALSWILDNSEQADRVIYWLFTGQL